MRLFKLVYCLKDGKQIWHTIPSIEFEGIYYNSGREKEILGKLGTILQNCLMNMIKIQQLTFNLLLSNDPVFESFLNQCLCYVVGCKVGKLDIRFDSYDGRYNLPQTIFYAKSLDMLVLEDCNLEPPTSNLSFPSLRKLRLVNVYADDQLIIIGCPSLVYLEGFEKLEVFGLSKLEEFKVENLYELEW